MGVEVGVVDRADSSYVESAGMVSMKTRRGESGRFARTPRTVTLLHHVKAAIVRSLRIKFVFPSYLGA